MGPKFSHFAVKTTSFWLHCPVLTFLRCRFATSNAISWAKTCQNHLSMPVFRLQAGFLAFLFDQRADSQTTAPSWNDFSQLNPGLSWRAKRWNIERELGEAEFFQMRATQMPTIRMASGFCGCNGRFKSAKEWQPFTQLPSPTEPQAEINEIQCLKSGFRLLLQPICFYFLSSSRRTNRQWALRVRRNMPPAEHAGTSKFIAHICHSIHSESGAHESSGISALHKPLDSPPSQRFTRPTQPFKKWPRKRHVTPHMRL